MTGKQYDMIVTLLTKILDQLEKRNSTVSPKLGIRGPVLTKRSNKIKHL